VTQLNDQRSLVICGINFRHGDVAAYAATSSHTDIFQLAILTTVTLARTSNALPDDGVTASKHVGAVLMLILM
jgi:hypothetical protein